MPTYTVRFAPATAQDPGDSINPMPTFRRRRRPRSLFHGMAQLQRDNTAFLSSMSGHRSQPSSTDLKDYDEDTCR